MSENYCRYEEIKDYKSAFKCFKQRFLKERKSIFNLDDDNEILNKASVKYLIDNFVKNGYVGDATSIEKFCYQLTSKHLINVSEAELDSVQQNAIEILATAVLLWRLPAVNSNKESRKKSVSEILELNSSFKGDLENNIFFKNEFSGFAMPGIGYNINKANELAYIINFLDNYLSDSNFDIINYLKSNDSVLINESKTYNAKDEEQNKQKIGKRIYENPITINPKSEIKTYKISINNPLLYLFDPDNYQPIISTNHKKLIYDTFKNIETFKECISEDDDIDATIKKIKTKLQKINGEYHFYHDSVRNIWLGGLDFESKNMILHGAPGSGKTYMTEETIKARKLIENNSEYELVQFHPSYGYEDFIEGIKPTGLDNGQMKFELKNGIFKQMCIDAFNNLIESQNDKTKLKTFYFIADEINRAELSRVFGELLLCLEDDKRLRIVDGKLQGTKIKTSSSNLWGENHVVVFTDAEDKILNNSDDKKQWYFGVPENIYFIGTMNDIDRSVDSFDMALRRRFVWKQYRCDYEAIANKYKDEKSIESYITTCKSLNNHIIDEKGFNLSDSYELGQSYFMKPKKLIKKELDRVWLEHISPILKEYLRAEYSEKDIGKKLEEAQKLFKI